MFAKNFRQGEKWLRGKITSQKGPVTFVVELENGGQCQRHQDHLRSRSDEAETSLVSDTSDEDSVTVWPAAENTDNASEPEEGSSPTGQAQTERESEIVSGEPRRYPSRVRHAPDRLGH